MVQELSSRRYTCVSCITEAANINTYDSVNWAGIDVSLFKTSGVWESDMVDKECLVVAAIVNWYLGLRAGKTNDFVHNIR